MGEQVILTQVPVIELINSFREIVREEIKAEMAAKENEKLLTATETAAFFKISRPTLQAHTEKGLLTAHYFGGKVYYKYSEIMQSLDKVKRKS